MTQDSDITAGQLKKIEATYLKNILPFNFGFNKINNQLILHFNKFRLYPRKKCKNLLISRTVHNIEEFMNNYFTLVKNVLLIYYYK